MTRTSTNKSVGSTSDDMEKVDKSLRKGTEGFLSVLDRLEGVSRNDDFKRLDE